MRVAAPDKKQAIAGLFHSGEFSIASPISTIDIDPSPDMGRDRAKGKDRVMTSTTWYRIGSLVVAAGVLAASSWPSLSISPLGWSFEDKLQHLLVYTLLSYLAFRGWASVGSRWTASWLILLILACFAAADEFHQRWIPGRYVEWEDFLADGAGVLAGFLAATWQNRRRRSQSPAPMPDSPAQ
jgi:hypothetical protein